MRVRQAIKTRRALTSKERFEILTTFELNVRDQMLMNPDVDIVDAWIEVDHPTRPEDRIPEECIIVRSLY